MIFEMGTLKRRERRHKISERFSNLWRERHS